MSHTITVAFFTKLWPFVFMPYCVYLHSCNAISHGRCVGHKKECSSFLNLKVMLPLSQQTGIYCAAGGLVFCCCCFQNQLFSQEFFQDTIRVSKSLDPDRTDVLSGRIWVQTLCKSYQQVCGTSCYRV